jgi:hypothetical protein
MAYRNPPILTPEEKMAARQAAQEERERIIQKAIKKGASVQYITSRLTSDEQETLVSWDNSGYTIIDTTIPRDITKCIKRGWKIISITYYKDTDTIAGMIFKGKSTNIAIKNVK